MVETCQCAVRTWCAEPGAPQWHAGAALMLLALRFYATGKAATRFSRAGLAALPGGVRRAMVAGAATR